jgi:type I site-specific restriction-modification system R (restriction) subunit
LERTASELGRPILVFITDRLQLDKQLTGVLARAQHEAVRHARNIRELKELLSKDAPDLITSTLQKIQEAPEAEMMEELNASSKIVVLVDEAHRIHYSSMGVNLNVALPNAPKIAFTGTPLMKEQKTRNAFGTYIDTYTIEQAVADGATLQIIYEGREVNTKVTGDSLDKLFDQYFADKTKDEKEAIKAKFGKEKAVLEAPQRIAMVAADLLEHYRNNIQPNGSILQGLSAVTVPEGQGTAAGWCFPESSSWCSPPASSWQSMNCSLPMGCSDCQYRPQCHCYIDTRVSLFSHIPTLHQEVHGRAYWHISASKQQESRIM